MGSTRFMPSMLSSIPISLFFETIRTSPTPTLFPYTTLFRSILIGGLPLRRICRPRLRVNADSGRRCFFGNRMRHHGRWPDQDRKSTRLNSSHANISYAVFCLKKKIATSDDGPVEHVHLTSPG